MAKFRRLIVCMDGTSNEVGDRQTHVVRIYRGLKTSKTQIPYYVQGVGTLDTQTLRRDTRAKRDSIWGLAFGKGLEDDVLEAYRFLSTTYDWDTHDQYLIDNGRDPKTPDTRDEIHFVGFSRGAYAARVLAGFLYDFGLLRPNALHMAAQAFRHYRSLSDADENMSDGAKYAMLRRYDAVFMPQAPRMGGMVIFDTVASMIRFRRVWHNLKTTFSPIELSTHRSTTINPALRYVIHAMAIDDKRTFFRPLLWQGTKHKTHRRQRKAKDQIVRQVWFAGYHGDIGGSAREDRSGVGKITLAWAMDQMDMIGEKWEWRRAFKPREVLGKGTGKHRYSVDGRIKPGPDYGAHLHNSMTAFWRIFELIPKTIKRRSARARGFPWYLPLSEPRQVPDDMPIHRSVFDRREDGRRCYRPVNIAHRTRKDHDPNDPALFNPSYSPRSARGGDT
ncbi:T6SS phospholipase effector Tle1-like catalytic domain-containing protein [Pseudooctadecabacter sp.]|uniref:T6SS phospholipase effector Tle1-like catalytic domain-containing protein n=1 Tax=Pseudooctadecabacter sp. TaxID=1966338 RepID=UPI0025F50E51|nr:DUF2235 domain-containing protein [Pseudooctadecabacter sp.]